MRHSPELRVIALGVGKLESAFYRKWYTMTAPGYKKWAEASAGVLNNGAIHGDE